MEEKEVNRIFIRRSPKVGTVIASVSEFEGGTPLFVSNYEASQKQLSEDFVEQEKIAKAELRKQRRKKK